jgi:hypothetical protein
MNRSSAAKKLTSFIVLIALLGSISVQASGGLPPLKRLGQGIGDRRTGEKLQLACVGEVKGDSLERGCELIQFLATSAGGDEVLVGPVLDLSKSNGSVTREIRDELKCYGLFKHVTSGRFFYFSRIGFGDLGEEKRSRCNNPRYSTLSKKEWEDQRDRKDDREDRRNSILAPVFVVGGAGVLAYFLITGALGTAGAFLFVPGVYASMFVVDGISYPFRMLFQGPGGPLGVRAKNVEALESRAQVAWQIKPKKMSHRRFQRVLDRLEKLDGRGPSTGIVDSIDGVELMSIDSEMNDSIVDSTPMDRPSDWVEVNAFPSDSVN